MAQDSDTAPLREPPIAIFVRADDLSLAHEVEYGPTIKRSLLSAILAVDEQRRCQFQTYWGSLVLPAWRLARASSAPTPSIELALDPFLLWSSANALCRSGRRGWNTLGAHVPWLLGNSNVYIGVFSRLSSSLHARLDEQLQSQSWYVGAMEVELDNSLHRRVFSLIPGWRYSQAWVDNPTEGGITVEELIAGLAVGGAGLADHPIAARHCQIPWSSASVPHDAPVTTAATAFEIGTTYQESIAALVHRYQQAERPLSYEVGRRQPLLDELRGKLHDYALNPGHQKGGKEKAEFFRKELGLEQQDWKLLAIQLISSLQSAEPLNFRDEAAYGERQHLRFEISAPVVGLNGKTKSVKAAWKIEDGFPAQLVTVTPEKRHLSAEEADPLAPGDWTALYNIARVVADRALEECRPTPIALTGLKGTDVAPEGMAGFALLCFPDSSNEFVRWLLSEGHAFEDSFGARIIAPGFDLEPAVAWAEAMADVLQKANQPCSVEHMLD
ncbi:DUF6883 domain-containing protein [Lentzea flaviverrucosa]|uniref:DUF6883 domain-containing protein n=1 Tax=Lentzea flaviverrucosa TaxID=200379 RepID=A0A1H9SI78_9PSEU|nr:DUF6883 domain-containing protein [Lentzea flaviverrucosa]RDI25383.1 hypothetical protein DFR72_10875 [Lentzea flaviverrucosa]SER84677.1 hypothetical protein SAMN05216195_10776 [Lentzea flaviverrucosa]